MTTSRTNNSRIFRSPTGFLYLCLTLAALMSFFTSSPQAADSAILVNNDALFTAFRTEDADLIMARSGRFHINSDRTVVVESELGTATVSHGEAIVNVSSELLEVQSVVNSTAVDSDSETVMVAEGETFQRTAQPQEQDPVLTSLGMCEQQEQDPVLTSLGMCEQQEQDPVLTSLGMSE